MGGIARLLCGDGVGRLPGLFDGGDGDWFEMADRVRRSGEWCGSTPGRGWAAAAVRGATRPRDERHQVTTRGFRAR